MRLSTCLAFFSATTVAAGLFDGAFKQEAMVDDDQVKVPGDNPLSTCHSPDNYLVKITHLDLDPNPPLPGKTLTINATATLKEKVESGAYVVLQVKVGAIPLIKRTEDICAQVESVGKECPLEAGEIRIVKDVEIPREVPPAIFTVEADAYTDDSRLLTCLTGPVDFRPKMGH